MTAEIKDILETYTARYNQPAFIQTDPISIPHRFTRREDIEIMGFWVAMMAWGQRRTIINKAGELIDLMDGAPYEFIRHHREKDRRRFAGFKHRTFQYIDALYFLSFFQDYYRQHASLEDAFSRYLKPEDVTVANALSGFHELFFSLPDAPARTRKHVSSPVRKSTCKRLNMFLRWMVRKDGQGVDFGIWEKIRPSQLLIPLDVHVDRVARHFNLIERRQTDWLTVLELTDTLRTLDPRDPVKFDYALFGLGVLQFDDLRR